MTKVVNIQRGGGKLLPFPTEGRLHARLLETQQELSSIYDTIQQGYDLMSQLEEKAHDKESEYNDLLLKYSKLVGPENIPIALLESASRNVMFDADKQEITFTPWEEDDEES